MLLARNVLTPEGFDEHRRFWNPDAQTMPADELAAMTAAGLAEEWARAWDLPLPFYRDKFARAGFGRNDLPDLADVPRTTKDELRRNEAEHPPLGTHRPVPLDRAVRVGRSSGTTPGRPVYILFGRRDFEAALEFQARCLWAYPLRPGQRFTQSWPMGLYINSTVSGFYHVKAGVLEVPVGPPVSDADALDHLRAWQLLEPDAFFMSGSQWQIYERVAGDNDIDFGAIVGGKVVALFDHIFHFEGPRRALEAQYGIHIRNLGGLAEVPGFGCPDCDHRTGLHTPADHVMVEACDPVTGRPVPDGTRGHLVISTYGLDAFFIRYDVEDIVTVEHSPCPCGHTGPRFRVLGRKADAVEVAGRMILPVDVQLSLFEAGAPEFQILTTESSADVLAVRLEAASDAAARECHDALTTDLGVPVRVEVTEPGSLPRSPFKPRRVVA